MPFNYDTLARGLEQKRLTLQSREDSYNLKYIVYVTEQTNIISKHFGCSKLLKPLQQKTSN